MTTLRNPGGRRATAGIERAGRFARLELAVVVLLNDAARAILPSVEPAGSFGGALRVGLVLCGFAIVVALALGSILVALPVFLCLFAPALVFRVLPSPAACAVSPAARRGAPLDDPGVRAEIDRAQRIIEAQHHRIREALRTYARLVELDRRRVCGLREQALDDRLPRPRDRSGLRGCRASAPRRAGLPLRPGLFLGRSPDAGGGHQGRNRPGAFCRPRPRARVHSQGRQRI